MTRLAAVAGAIVMLVSGAGVVEARDELPSSMEAGADLTGVDGSDQVADTADVVPDLTVGSPRFQLTGAWRTLAMCESTLNPRAISRNGLYFGLFQFDRQTWAASGGLAYAARADFASPEAQLIVAQTLHARRGWAPWPVCGRGLR